MALVRRAGSSVRAVRSVVLSAGAVASLTGCSSSDTPLEPIDDPVPGTSPPEVYVIPTVRLPGIVYRPTALPFSPAAINGRGDVVGTLREGETSRAVLWRDGVMTILPSLADGESQAADLDDSGVVVGSSVDPLGRSRAVRWVDGVPEDLGTLGGEEAAALGINSVGQIVGVSETEGDLSGFLWTEGELTPLPPTPPNEFAYAEDINGEGIAVGWSAGNPAQDATIWVDGVPAKLPSLAYEASASAIGEDGVIVGGSIPEPPWAARAVRWVDGRVEELPTPPEVEFSGADDINDRGQIVGHAGGTVIWEGDRFLRIHGGHGRGINDRGQVIASTGFRAGYSFEARRTFGTRPPSDAVEPPAIPRGNAPPRARRPSSSSGLCRYPPLMSSKVENALRVAGCLESRRDGERQ